MPTFTSGNDIYVVRGAGTFDLDMLEGDDKLTVQGGDSTVAHMGVGDDLVQLKSGLASVFGDAGSDTFDVWAASATVDGGADNDLINIRGGPDITAYGGLGDDRFNFYADSTNVNLFGDDGNDDFFGYYHTITGSVVGGAGNDYFVQFTSGVLVGGAGNDVYRATVGGTATFSEAPADGIDTVQVARGQSYILPDNIENISVQGFSGSTLGTTLLLWGNALNNTIVAHNNAETLEGFDGNDNLSAKGGDDTLKGDAGNDYLDGGSGNDTIFGGNGSDTLQGRAGNDSMSGGDGNDTYYVDSLSDVVTEQFGEGIDVVRVSINNYTLPDFVENGIISSGFGIITLNGNALNNELTGTAGSDELFGDSGNDTLRGGAGNDALNGGFGNDTMAGGTGDDLYQVDNLSDVVVEAAGAGTDTVFWLGSFGDYTLGANVENGVANNGVAGFSLIGNALDNQLTDNGFNPLYGMGGNDTLTGGLSNNELHGGDGNDILTDDTGNDILDGGAGADTMSGGAGNDTYAVDDPGDLIIEAANGGDGDSATVVFSGYTLADNVENATYVGLGTLTGNASNNFIQGDFLPQTLIGGGGNDSFNGLGGGDILIGGTGDDNYFVYSLADVVTENSGEGTDGVQAAISGYTLAANVENGSLLVTGTLSGNGLDNILIGSSGADTLTGGNGNDQLFGGAGDDTLNGGVGNDKYQIDDIGDSILEASGTDIVYSNISSYTLPSEIENGTIVYLSAFGAGGTMIGNSGNNVLTGGLGSDSISGGNGDDIIIGGAGADLLDAGTSPGLDQFVYLSVNDSPAATDATITYDRIGIINTGDLIDVSAIDADTGVAGDQAFTLVGTPTGAAGEMWTVFDSGTNLTHLYGDVDGGGADLEIAIFLANPADLGVVL